MSLEPNFNKITKAGYDHLKAEIRDLEAARPNKIKILSAARALGDLSENAEYSAAKRDLRHLESRMRFLKKTTSIRKNLHPF